jgi:hypothetical protein
MSLSARCVFRSATADSTGFLECECLGGSGDRALEGSLEYYYEMWECEQVHVMFNTFACFVCCTFQLKDPIGLCFIGGKWCLGMCTLTGISALGVGGCSPTHDS